MKLVAGAVTSAIAFCSYLYVNKKETHEELLDDTETRMKRDGRVKTLWSMIGPSISMCGFTGATFVASSAHFAKLQLKNAAMGGILYCFSISLRSLDTLPRLQDGLLLGGADGIRLHYGAILSSIAMGVTSCWLMAKARAQFFWWLVVVSFGAAPVLLDSALKVRCHATQLRAWLHREMTELVPILREQRPLACARWNSALSNVWDSQALPEEATLKQILDLVQTQATEVIVQTIFDSFLPGMGSAAAEPVAQILGPNTSQAVAEAVNLVDVDVLVAALKQAHVQVAGDADGPEGLLGMRVKKQNCLEVLDTMVFEPAFDGAVTAIDVLVQDPAKLTEALTTLGGMPRLFLKTVREKMLGMSHR